MNTLELHYPMIQFLIINIIKNLALLKTVSLDNAIWDSLLKIIPCSPNMVSKHMIFGAFLFLV